jgi:hypothetical protein
MENFSNLTNMLSSQSPHPSKLSLVQPLSQGERCNLKNTQLVTILVPNYKTLELTKLCMRLLRKYTDPQLAHVIAVDNDSQDASTEYLRSLPWIEFLERKNIPGDSAPISHGLALDLALEKVTTPYVLSIHTDTLVKRSDWLNFLLSFMEKNPNAAGVGSWKLESKPLYKRILKQIEWYFQKSVRGASKKTHYLRSHCALYRTEYLRKYHLHFTDEQLTPGESMHHQLIKKGHDMIFLPSEILCKYVDHINHATVVLNPEFIAPNKTIKHGLKRIQQTLDKLEAKEILKNEALDH